MSFFKKLKDRLFKSSSKIDEGLEAIVQEAADEAPAKQDREEAEVLLDSCLLYTSPSPRDRG